MAGEIPPMIVEIELETKRIRQQLDELNRQFDEMGKTVSGQAKHVDGINNSFKSLGKTLIGLAAGAAVVNFFKDAVAGASSFEAEFEGVNQIFGSAASIIQDYAKTAAYSVGLSETAALRAAKGFGVFAGAAGLAGNDAANFSLQMVQAAGDLGSFYDLPTGDAMAAIQSGLRGQFEPLRRFNILIDDATLRQRALAMGMIDTTKQALTPQQKALAAQVEIMQQMGPAAGDFVKYADTYGNAIKTVGALIEDMKTRLGQQLLPVLAQVAMALMPLIEEIGPLASSVFKALEPAITALVPAIQKLIPTLEPLFKILENVAGTFSKLLSKLLPPFIEIIDALWPVVGALVDVFLKLVEAALPPVVTLIEKGLIPILDVVSDILVSFVIPYIDELIAQFSDFLPTAIDLVVTVLGTIVEILKPIIQWVKELEKTTGISFAQMTVMLSPFTIALKAIDFILKGIIVTIEAAKMAMSGDWIGAANLMGMDVNKAYKQIRPDVSSGHAGDAGLATALEAQKRFTAPTIGGWSIPDTSGGKADATKAAKNAAKQTKTVRDAIKGVRDDVLKYEKQFDTASTEAWAKYNDKITEITKKRDEDLAKALTDHTANVTKIQQDFANRLNDIVKQSMDRLRGAFKSASSMDIGSTFASLMQNSGLSNILSTEMKNGMTVAVSWWGQATNEGGVGGVVKALKDKLEGAKKLAENAAALSGAGFSQTFIEQVVGQGTEVGNQMASEILASSPETKAELQKLYGDLEVVSETGLDKLAQQIYDKNGLATTELKKMYEDTQAQLVQALADEQAAYAQAVTDIEKTYTDAFAQAQVDLNKALSDAYQSLADSLIATKKKFVEEMAALNLTAAQQKAVTSTKGGLTSKITDAKAGSAIDITINATTQKGVSAEEIAAATAQAIKFGVPITSIIPVSRLLA